MLFFITQRTAYEMHISDWSSDVCSTDLQAVGIAQLRADGGREAIANRAKAHGGQPFVRRVEAEMLGRPHLVLADFGGDDDVLGRARRLVKLGDGLLRHDLFAAVGIGEAVARAPAVDPRDRKSTRLNSSH